MGWALKTRAIHANSAGDAATGVPVSPSEWTALAPKRLKTIPTVVTGSLFGRRSNGQISALYLATRQLAGALGVQALGAAMDTAGSLGRVLSMGALVLALLAAGSIWSTPRLPRKAKAG